MFCRNCGKEINENNNFCTSCGYKFEKNITQNSYVTKVIITRKKGALSYSKSPMKILINDNYVAAINDNETFEIDLPFGQYRLIADPGCEVLEYMIDAKPEIKRVYIDVMVISHWWQMSIGKTKLESVRME